MGRPDRYGPGSPSIQTPTESLSELDRPPADTQGEWVLPGDQAPGLLSTLRGALPAESAWEITHVGVDAAQEPEVESRFTVANGYLGVRGSLSTPLDASQPHTYIAGLFDTLIRADAPAVPALVSAPDWLRFELTTGSNLGLARDEQLEHSRTLDMRHGMLWDQWRQRDEHGHTVDVRTLRFVSLVDRSLAVQVVELQPASGAGPGDTPLTLESWIAHPAIGLELDSITPTRSLWRTQPGGHVLALATDATLLLASSQQHAAGAHPVPGAVVEGDHGRRWTWQPEPADAATFVRFVGLATTPPGATRGDCAEPAHTALATLERARALGLTQLAQEHAAAWAERWAAGDVEIHGDDGAQRGLRFATYHLISAANPFEDHVSVGARAL